MHTKKENMTLKLGILGCGGMVRWTVVMWLEPEVSTCTSRTTMILFYFVWLLGTSQTQ